jgi:hypothetical protein
MVRIPRLGEYVGTDYEPQELLTTAEEVLKFAEVSSKLRVAHIAGEYPTNASAAGQLISLA